MSSPAPNTGNYEWWTTYTFKDGKWANSQSEPAAKFLNPPASEVTVNHPPVEAEWYPITRHARFENAIAAGAAQTSVRDYVHNALSSKFTEVEVEFRDDGKTLSIKYGPPTTAEEGTLAIIGVALSEGSKPEAPIEAALDSVRSNHLLADDATWNLSANPQ